MPKPSPAPDTLHQTSSGPGSVTSGGNTTVGQIQNNFAAPSGPQPPKRLAYHLYPDAHAGFIGRKELLKDLRAALKPGKKNVIQQAKAVNADGGVGKTSLAIHLGAELFAKETFDYVLFLAATSADALRGDLSALCSAQYLNLPAQEAREAAVQYQAVLAFLNQPEVSRRTLLILDGADDEAAREAVTVLRGELHGCAFLITSRHADWGKGVTPFPLELFTDAEARDFLRDRFGECTTIPDELLDTIARELGHLPLALEIAASYIRSQRLSPQDWLQEWQNAPEATYEHHSKDHIHYPLPLGRVWDQSFARLDESARQMLHCLAFIAPRPAALPLEPFERLPQWSAIRQSLGTLADASLIQWDSSKKTLLIHRLLQAVTRQRLSPEETQAAFTILLFWMPMVLPHPDWNFEGWKLWQRLEPHLQALLFSDLGEKMVFVSQNTKLSHILNNYALWLFHRAQHREAEPLSREALRLAEASFGPEHPEVATRLNNLAQLLKATNRLAEAEVLMLRALKIDETHFGPNHPNVAVRLNNLALLLQATNRVLEAEEPLRRSLMIDEAVNGLDHPTVGIRLNNLANLLQNTNRLVEAEKLMRRVLRVFEQNYPPNHPYIATAHGNLATLLQDTGRLAEAEQPMMCALTIDEAIYGPEHPKMAIRLNNLAQLLKATKRLAEAEEPMRRSLFILASFTAQTGHAHPQLRAVLNNYVALLLEKGLSAPQVVEAALSALTEGGMPPEQIQHVMPT